MRNHLLQGMAGQVEHAQVHDGGGVEAAAAEQCHRLPGPRALALWPSRTQLVHWHAVHATPVLCFS